MALFGDQHVTPPFSDQYVTLKRKLLTLLSLFSLILKLRNEYLPCWMSGRNMK